MELPSLPGSFWWCGRQGLSLPGGAPMQVRVLTIRHGWTLGLTAALAAVIVPQ